MRRLLSCLLVVGALASGLIFWQRYQTYPINRVVEVAISNAALREYAFTQSYDLDELLTNYKEAGLTSLTIGEVTLQALMAHGQLGYRADYPVNVGLFSEQSILDQARLAGLEPASLIGGEPRADEVYVLVRNNPALAQWLEERLTLRLGPERVRVAHQVDGLTTLAVKGEQESVATLPLGIFPGDLEVAQRHGLRPILGLTQSEGMPLADPDAYVADLPTELGPVLPYGELVPGYPAELPIEALKAKGATLVIEKKRPLGSGALAEGLDFNVIKAYRPYRGERLSDWVVAVKDRNLRLFLLEPHRFPIAGSTATRWQTLDDQLNRLTQFENDIAPLGFRFGLTEPMVPYHPPLWALVLICFGAVAAGLLLLSDLVKLPSWLLLSLLGLGGLAASLLVWRSVATGRQVVALASAIIYPALGGAWALQRRPLKQPLLDTLAFVLTAATGAALGALAVNGLLSDIRYSQELLLFRGVNVANLAPSLILLIYCLWRWRRELQQAFGHRLGRVLKAEVRVWHVVALGIVGLAGLVLINRSGNFGALPISQLELQLRAWLDEVLIARPRTKEFAFAYPLLVLAAYFARQQAPWITRGLTVLGLVGMASIVNSFSHIHSPVFNQTLRSLHGLWIGLLLGAIALIPVHIFWRWSQTWGRER